MTTSRRYTFLVPRLDRTGPCNVAVDIARSAAAAGWRVCALYLSGEVLRDDLSAFAEVRRFRWTDIVRLEGVLHTHCLRPDLMGALFAVNRRCVTVTTLHNHFQSDVGFDYPRWKVSLAWQAWKRAIALFDHRVCISNTMRRYYRRKLPGLAFDLAYNFRPEPAAAPASPQARTVQDWLEGQRPHDRIRLAYVGALNRRKNLLPLIAALEGAPPFALAICGQGPLRDELEAAVRERGLADRVLFAGQIADPGAVMTAADFLVLPSLAEGLPLVVIEAASRGLPCLMSNIAVHRELAALGLGVVFERHRLADFSSVALAAHRRSDAQSRSALVSTWRRLFSPQPGFARYERLFESRTLRGADS